MEMTFHQIGGYLHHARAIEASEQLEAYSTMRLLHLTPRERRREIAEMQRVAGGTPAPSAAQTEAEKRAEFDAGWVGLRRRLGGGGRRPGDRVLIPAGD